MENRISLHKLVVFETVISVGSVSRAADRLFVAQPVVTMHIRTLEEKLGVQLFARAKRPMELTEGGHAVHRWATEVLRRSRELSRELGGLAEGSEGSIVLSTSMALGCYDLPPLLARFRREQPGVNLEVDIQESTQALAAVHSGETDFAVVAVETTPAVDGFATEQLGSCEMVLITDPDCELPSVIAVDELATLPFVEGPSRQRLDRQLARHGIRERNVAMELRHPEAVKAVVAGGLGVALLPRSAVRSELKRGELRELEIDGLRLGLPVYLAQRSDKELSQAQRDLIDEIRAYVTDLAAAPCY